MHLKSSEKFGHLPRRLIVFAQKGGVMLDVVTACVYARDEAAQFGPVRHGV